MTCVKRTYVTTNLKMFLDAEVNTTFIITVYKKKLLLAV